MAKIVIQPYAATLEGKVGKNPKDWPYFNDLIAALPQHEFYQIGSEELPLKGAKLMSLDRKGVIKLINECDTWISVDTWLQHVATLTCKKKGMVIFTRSDPKLFGHKENLNIYKSKMYFKDPYSTWELSQRTEAAFVSVDVAISNLLSILPN
jgi:hypothetical protein